MTTFLFDLKVFLFLSTPHLVDRLRHVEYFPPSCVDNEEEAIVRHPGVVEDQPFQFTIVQLLGLVTTLYHMPQV